MSRCGFEREEGPVDAGDCTLTIGEEGDGSFVIQRIKQQEDDNKKTFARGRDNIVACER